MVTQFIWVYSAIYLPRWASPSLAAADLRAELIPAERQYIYQLLQDGKITDEGCRRIERELDPEEAGICRKRQGGVESPL
jgi:hypothetical protein